MSTAKSAEAANGSATQHSAKQLAQSARRSGLAALSGTAPGPLPCSSRSPGTVVPPSDPPPQKAKGPADHPVTRPCLTKNT
ncbi:hypothetical protein Skr01_11320 [Sphaerisporangium krabiense]|nr:hypothetical protein Skr01_11320 [Sphaerisporangium krabiense]